MLTKRNAGYWLSLPYVLYNLVFWLYPFIWAFLLGFNKWNFLSPKRTFVGLRNFQKALEDPLFWKILGNTAYFMVVFLTGTLVFSLALAMFFNRIRYGKGVFVAGYLLSNLSAGVAYSQVFKLLMAGDGIVNKALALLGIEIPWFIDTRIAMASIALMVIWKSVGYFGLIFLAGLQAIPKDYYDAAEVDGAGFWAKFRNITIPLLNPAITSVMVFATIWSFQVFAEPYIITGGGPFHSTQTFLLQIYFETWQAGHAGYGSALALVVAILGLATMITTRKLVERDIGL
jgi:multiple sugar transport system permease protein